MLALLAPSVLCAQSCLTLCNSMPARLLHPQHSPGKNPGVGSHSLLWGIFLTQGWNLSPLYWQAVSLPLSHLGSPWVPWHRPTDTEKCGWAFCQERVYKLRAEKRLCQQAMASVPAHTFPLAGTLPEFSLLPVPSLLKSSYTHLGGCAPPGTQAAPRPPQSGRPAPLHPRSLTEQVRRKHRLDWHATLVAQTVKNLPAMRETQLQSLRWDDALEKGTATHSSILA